MTGDIHAEQDHVVAEPAVHAVTAAVCVVNFFFVTIVLMNLVRRRYFINVTLLRYSITIDGYYIIEILRHY